MIVDISGHFYDLIVRKPTAKGRHGIFAARDLINDRFLAEATGKVLYEGVFLESLLRLKNVFAAGVASGTVALEDLLPVKMVDRLVGSECGQRRG